MEKDSARAELIARLVEDGQDLSSYFTNDGKMMPPLESDDVPNEDAIEELKEEAREKQGTDSLP